ncbi:MAG: hypothetical protein RSA65_08635 [Clostridia bacterium]
MKLFHVETIEQFKIGAWLERQGLAAEDVAVVELVDRYTVRIINAAGQWMDVECKDGEVKINQD